MKTIASGLACAWLLLGCAHAPDAAIGYRLATTQVRFKVVRTVSCDQDNRPIIATAVTPSTSHVADDTRDYFFPLSSIQGWLSDTDTTFEFYADRRLKGINATSAGNGAPVLKTVLSLAFGVAAFGAGGTVEACARVAAAGNKKPLSLVYEGAVTTSATGPQAIPPDAASAPYANDDTIKSLVQAICAVVEERRPGAAPVTRAPDTAAAITVREPGVATIRIAIGADDGACSAAPLWRDSLPVAQLGALYRLPVPRAAAFGKQAFAASFAESGALTMVQYGASGGAANSVNALAALAAASTAGSAAQQAADLKAQADLIYQQQRLVACLADRANCR